MKLQIAVDVADTQRCVELGELLHDVVDIYEVGTPVIVKEGLAPVRELKRRYPHMTILADAKIMDGGALECGDMCDAGADVVTVLALADDATIQEVVTVAHKYQRKVMADLICIKNITQRSRELVAMGVDYVCVHTGVDMQKQGRTPLLDLKELVNAIDPSRTAVAGGVSLATIASYKALNPGIIISGSAIYGAPNIRATAIDMKEVLANGC